MNEFLFTVFPALALTIFVGWAMIKRPIFHLNAQQRLAFMEILIIFVMVMLDLWTFRFIPALFYGAQIFLGLLVLAGFAMRVIAIQRTLVDCPEKGRKIRFLERLGDYTEEIGIGRFSVTAEKKKGRFSIDFSWYWAWTLAWSSTVALAVICIAGYYLKPGFWKHDDFWAKRIDIGTLKYIRWGFIQQFFLQGYVASRLYSIFVEFPEPGECERRAAIKTAVCAGLLFFLAHIPNPTLMITTPIMGAAAVYIFLNCRNVWMIAVAHGILGNALGVCLAENLRVGIFYFHPYLPYLK